MPYDITVIDNGRGMYCRGSGQMLGREIHASVLQANSQWVGKLDYMIVDLREVEVAISTPQEKRAILELEVEFSKKQPQVVLVGIATNELQFGIARMWEQMLAPTNWIVRATIGAAEANDFLQSQLAALDLPPAARVT
ncbi:MAG: hypothetical protein JSR77_11030 [Planctomycetes bacterium]|nr:hypothetical protein [Planctomycetota bacterium]